MLFWYKKLVCTFHLADPPLLCKKMLVCEFSLMCLQHKSESYFYSETIVKNNKFSHRKAYRSQSSLPEKCWEDLVESRGLSICFRSAILECKIIFSQNKCPLGLEDTDDSPSLTNSSTDRKLFVEVTNL